MYLEELPRDFTKEISQHGEWYKIIDMMIFIFILIKFYVFIELQLLANLANSLHILW